MADALQNFIDGKWVDAQDGARFDVFDPATGEVIATAPDSTQADVDAAVSAARRTFDDGSWWPGTSGRGPILLRAADIVRREQERLAAQESLDSGKPIGDAREDVAEVAFMFEYYGGWATKIEGDSHHVSADAMSWSGRSRWASPSASRPGTTLDDGGPEGGAGARGRVHVHPEATRADAAHLPRAAEDPRGGRSAGRSLPRAHGVRRNRRCASRRAPGRGQGRLHRIQRGGQGSSCAPARTR